MQLRAVYPEDIRPVSDPANPFEILLDSVAWRALEPPPAAVVTVAPEIPYPMAEGFLRLGAARLRVLRMSDGSRVLDPCDLDEVRWPGSVAYLARG